MLNLIRLRHILAVARTGSFSLAAEEVRISQPALSRSIQAFEAEFGLRLFDRGKGGVVLTPAGKLAVENARNLLAGADDFERELRGFGRGEAGQTGIGMGPLMASLLLPRLGADLLKRSPALTVFTRTGPPDRMLEFLLDGTIELVVGNSWQIGMVPGVTEERLGILPLGIAVRRDHPLAARNGLTMRDLDDFPVARAFDYASAGQSKAGAFVSENFSILREVVLETDCTWLVAPAFVARELEEGSLAMLPIADLPNAEARTSLIYLRSQTRSPAADLLAEAVRSMFRKLVRLQA